MTLTEQKRFIEEFKESRVIVVCRGVDEDKIVKVAEALYAGGIRFMEVPFNQSDAASFASTARKIALVAEAMQGKMHVGAGTTLTEEQLRLAAEAGAEVIVAPNMDEDIIRMTKEAGLISMPGCMTPSEMLRAHKLGADLIKLFPSSVVNVKMIKEIAVPLSHLSMVCFGGVTADNVGDFMTMGLAGVGVGSAILDKQAVATGDYGKITALARAITEKI